MSELLVNTFEKLATLTAVLKPTETILSVSAAAPASLSSGTFRIVIDQEIMLVLSGATTTKWKVTRAIEGSETEHATGSEINHELTAGALKALFAQVGTDSTIGGPGGSPLSSLVVTNGSQLDVCRVFGAEPGTDCTKALQEAITAAALMGGGSVVFSKPGTYLISGPQVTGTSNGHSYSGQVLFPSVTPEEKPITINIEGTIAPPMAKWSPFAAGNQPLWSGGVILLSNATSGSIFDVKSANSGGVYASLVQVGWRNITVRAPNEPKCNALDMHSAGSLITDGLLTDVNAPAHEVGKPAEVPASPNEKPTSGSIAIHAPWDGNMAHNNLRDTEVFGYGEGLRHYEHTTLDYFIAQLCIVGLAPNGQGNNPHTNFYTRALLQGNIHHIRPQSPTVVFGQIDMEDNSSSEWWGHINDIEDENNYLRGQLFYRRTEGAGELPKGISLKGAAGIRLRSIENASESDGLLARASFGMSTSPTTTTIVEDLNQLTFALSGSKAKIGTKEGQAHWLEGENTCVARIAVPGETFDMSATITMSPAGGRGEIGLAFLGEGTEQSTFAFWVGTAGTNGAQLYKISSGSTYTQIGTTQMAGEITANGVYDLRVRYAGGTLDCYVNATRVLRHALTKAELEVYALNLPRTEGNSAPNRRLGLWTYFSGSGENGESTYKNFVVRPA